MSYEFGRRTFLKLSALAAVTPFLAACMPEGKTISRIGRGVETSLYLPFGENDRSFGTLRVNFNRDILYSNEAQIFVLDDRAPSVVQLVRERNTVRIGVRLGEVPNQLTETTYVRGIEDLRNENQLTLSWQEWILTRAELNGFSFLLDLVNKKPGR